MELSETLDEPIKPDEYKLAILALGQRARTLFRGFIALQDSAAPAAGRALLRPMIEINILIRFLNKSPELHLELWEAEGDRNAASIIEEHNAQHTERWGSMPVEEGVLDEKHERVRSARARAIAAAIAGVGKKGPVLPGMAMQLSTIAEPAASEAYSSATVQSVGRPTRTPAPSFPASSWSATTAPCPTRTPPREQT